MEWVEEDVSDVVDTYWDALVEKTLDARENKARTFRSSVGAAYLTREGEIFPGFNIESHTYDRSYHAEEVGILQALDNGVRGEEHIVMTEAYQDAGHDEIEKYPACPLHCWGTMYTFAHPELTVAVIDTDKGDLHYTCDLDEIRPPGEGQVFPSDTIKDAKPLHNMEPSRAEEPVYDKEYTWDTENPEPVINAALDAQKKAVTFEEHGPEDRYTWFTGAAFGMEDGDVVNGFPVQTWYHKGYRAEEVGSILAMAEGYTPEDFDVFTGVIPDAFVEENDVNGFLGRCGDTLGVLVEFARPDTRVLLTDTAGEPVIDTPLEAFGEYLTRDAFQATEKVEERHPRKNM